MRILLTGKNGQVGYELERSLQGLGEIIAVDRSQMDLTDLDQVRDVIRSFKPNLIVNPAAYTAVDKAESEPALAMQINGEAPGEKAEEAKKLNAAIIHYSTDYVFDGTKAPPYLETDSTDPYNAYGATKLAGEQAIQAVGALCLILRTSWVYGMRGSNFLLTMLRLAKERDELRIVADQHGAPTWCRTITETTAHIVAQDIGSKCFIEWINEKSGLYHLTAQESTTWHRFAKEIFNQAVNTSKPSVLEIASHEYPTPAKRPNNSTLSCSKLCDEFGLAWPSWSQVLELCLSN